MSDVHDVQEATPPPASPDERAGRRPVPVGGRVRLSKTEDRRRIRRKNIADKTAAATITFGGFAVILSILAILFVIVVETLPLWQAPSAELVGPPARLADLIGAREADGAAAGEALALGIDEYREIAYTVTAAGSVDFVSLAGRRPIERIPVAGLHGRPPTAVHYRNLTHTAALGTDDGRVIPLHITFPITFEGSTRISTPHVTEHDAIVLDPDGRALHRVVYARMDEDGERISAAGMVGPRTLLFVSRGEEESFLGEPAVVEHRADLSADLDADVTALALDAEQRNLFAAVATGEVLHWDVRDPATPKLAARLSGSSAAGKPVRAMTWLIGDRSLVMGDDAGGVAVWFQVRDRDDPAKLPFRRIHVMAPHAAPITAISAAPRNKGFVTADRRGEVRLQYATTETTLLRRTTAGSPITRVAYAPRTNGVLALDAEGLLYDWAVDNPHPEITVSALFGEVWYEGYDAPDYTWQSSSGTDDFEPKFSLSPLAYGTLKGTFYALLLAIPLSVCGAIYTSQFMHPALRNVVKPSVEVMAALPSVVLGFFAGLWLAPLVADMVPAVFLMAVSLPLVTLGGACGWRLLPLAFRSRLRPGAELFFLVPLIMATIAACVAVNPALEAALFAGDFPQWLYDSTGVRYDPRNSLIVGFAMGFAVIPIIYTICEDAFSNVPHHLISGSLALGATRWQTALRVVLPTASPGVFSAIMIGFGRAVGETMIVLMATGNTPVMDFDPFTGFRALSANIAVEIPEAPHGGTLYRTLFLAALLLFVSTFLVNTAAEVVRQRLRDRYGRI